MVAVQMRYKGDTYYIIGDFWEIVERLKEHQARFRFRARRWRWPESLSSLEQTMQPYPVMDISYSEAQVLQLAYDRVHMGPTQQWLNTHRHSLQLLMEWWEATRLKDNAKSQKAFARLKEQAEQALTVINLPTHELEREQVMALQQSRRMLEKYEERIVKWVGERVKARRREQVLARFESEMGLSRQNLLEIEQERGASRQALYEELAGLEWTSPEITELKTAAKILIKQHNKAKIRR